MVFYGSRQEAIVWWGFAFLIYMIFVGNRGLSTEVALWVLVVLITALACVIFYRLRRLRLDEEGLTADRNRRPQHWRWSDIRQMQLDRSKRMGRPTINFRVKGGDRVFLWGPWSVDETTIYTAMILAHERWRQTAAEPVASAAKT